MEKLFCCNKITFDPSELKRSFQRSFLGAEEESVTGRRRERERERVSQSTLLLSPSLTFHQVVQQGAGGHLSCRVTQPPPHLSLPVPLAGLE